MDAFLAALRASGASESTVKAYRAAILDFIAYIKGKSLDAIDVNDVYGWIESRLRGSDDPLEAKRRRTTMHYYTMFVRRWFRWLGIPIEVPVVPKPRAISVEALRPEEVARLLEAARDELDRLIVALLFETGLRAREAVELRLRDIDFESSTIRVRAGKYGEERIVFFGPLTAEALRRWLSSRPWLRPDDRILGLSYSALYKRLKSLAKRAGLDPSKVRPHVLRHTFATEALRRGVSLPAVQRLLGHKDVKTTQIYLHLVVDDLRQQYMRAFSQSPPAYAAYLQAPVQPAYSYPLPQAYQQPMGFQQPPYYALRPMEAPIDAGLGEGGSSRRRGRGRVTGESVW